MADAAYLLLAPLGLGLLAVLFIRRIEIVFWLLIAVHFFFGSISAYLSRDLTVLRGILEFTIVGVGLTVASCSMALQRTLRKSPLFGPVLWTSVPWVVVTLVGALVGLYSMGGDADEINYFVGDVVKFLFFPMFLLMAVWVVRSVGDLDLFLFRLLMIFWGFLAFDVSGYLWATNLGPEFSLDDRLISGSITFSPAYVVIGLYLLQQARSLPRRTMLSGFLLFSAVAIGLSLLRVLIVSLVIVLLGVFAVGTRETRFLVARVLAVLVVAVGLAVLVSPGMREYLKVVTERMNPATAYGPATELAGLGHRLEEVRVVGEKFKDSPGNLLLGFGFGGEIETFTLERWGLAARRVGYTTHNALVDILWRTGIFGLVTFLATIGWFLREALRLRHKYKLAEYIIPGIAIYLALLFFHGARFLFENMIMYVLFGGLLALRERARQAVGGVLSHPGTR